MKNNYFIKKQKKGWIVLLTIFCGLFANTALGQKNINFTGSLDNNWTTAGNWNYSGDTAVATYTTGSTTVTLQVANSNILVGDTISGYGIRVGTTITNISSTTLTISQSTLAAGAATNVTMTFATPQVWGVVPGIADIAVISNGANPAIAGGTYTVAGIAITNASGPSTGSTLTINSDVTFNVNSASVDAVLLKGGNIVNNGILSVTNNYASGTNNNAAFGITCGIPAVIPATATEFGYSGSGTLNINTSAGNQFSNGIVCNGLDALVTNTAKITYKMLFNGTTNFTLKSTTTAGVFAIKVLGGNATAFPCPVIIGGTGFTLPSGLYGLLIVTGGGNNVTIDAGTTLTATSVSGNLNHQISLYSFGNANPFSYLTNKGIINFSGTSSRGGIAVTGDAQGKVEFDNQGVVTINMSNATNNAPLVVPFNTSTGAIGGTANIRNSGTISLTNTATPAGLTTGCAFVSNSSSVSANATIINSGVLTLTGTNVVKGQTVTGTRTTITNTGLITSNSDFNLITISNSSTGTFAFAGATASVSPNALTTFISFATNNGKIQTRSGAAGIQINLAGVAKYGASSVVEPGGIGYGVVDFGKDCSVAADFAGKIVLQIGGNAVAGTNYDQVINTSSSGGFNIENVILDVTGIYTPGGPVIIDILTASTVGGFQGTITGTFSSVIGLTTGWSVNYIPGTAGSVTGKVQLVYSATSPTANTWNGATDTDWNIASNWSAGVPDQNSDVTIAAAANQPIIGTNVNIKSLTIDSSSSLTVNTTFNLTVKEAIVNNGTLTIANNANLIQTNNVTNTGAITINRNSNALSRLDYTIWSSPVASQNLLAFSPTTLANRFYNYNETTNLYNAVSSPSTTDFASASGYLIRMPDTHPTTPTVWNGSFTGVPNNGTITKAMTYNGALFGYNMVGNPYPSTIDAQAFITANTANIESSLYFWRKINAASGSAYAVYNPMGGTAATPSSALPSGTIQVGQGFFVKAKSASNLTFNNTMRVANNANQFFRTQQAQKDRIWLNLTNATGVFSQALIGYTADATSGVDMYDAKYINDSPIALTSNINNEEYSIQGRPTFDPSDVVALNFKTDAAGSYTIAKDHVDGLFATGQDIYLVDKITGTETNMQTDAYTFTATAGADNTRFSLKYQKTLGVNAVAFNENSVLVYRNNGTLTVSSGANTISNIKVFDIQGRLLVEQKEVNATSATIKNLRASQQVLLVKVTGADTTVVTKKAIN